VVPEPLPEPVEDGVPVVVPPVDEPLPVAVGVTGVVPVEVALPASNNVGVKASLEADPAPQPESRMEPTIIGTREVKRKCLPNV
jgi:hypothetical protein